MNHVPAATLLRVVLDTTSTLPLSPPEGPQCNTVALRSPAVTVSWSRPAIVRELARVLRTDLQWQVEYIQRRIRVMAQVAELVSPRAALRL